MADSLLTSLQRRTMLEDIARIGLALGRSLSQPLVELDSDPLPISAAPPAELSRNESETTPLERLALLQRLWPCIETALVTLARIPRSDATVQATQTPFRRTRGGANVVQQIITQHPGAAAWMDVWMNSAVNSTASKSSDSPGSYAVPSPGGPLNAADPMVLENRLQVCGESLIHRFVRTFLAELEQEARHLAGLAEFCADADCADRAQRLVEAARQWRARPPFAGRIALTALERLQLRQGIGVPQNDVAFCSLLAQWRLLRRPLQFDWSDSPLLFLPALEGWHLYEIWCFLTVARCLQHQGWLPVDGGVIQCTPEGVRLRLVTGRASQLRFRRQGTSADGRSDQLALTYQPLFSSANRRHQRHQPDDHEISSEQLDDSTLVLAGAQTEVDNGLACTSLTHDMQPDIALEWRGRLYLLDAKYRRYALREVVGQAEPGSLEDRRGYQALLQDVDKMHTYRDGIVRGTYRAVSDAWCLWPGPPAANVLAYPAPTFDLPFGTAGIGALAVRPGDEPEALRRLLNHWLASRV